MCGVCGILYKHGGAQGNAPIGDHLIKMLASLVHRGADSTGVTVAGEKETTGFVLRLHASDGSDSAAAFARAESRINELGGTIKSRDTEGGYLRLGVDYRGNSQKLAEALFDLEGLSIHSMGVCSEVIKDVGTAPMLDSQHRVARLKGSHGIGHVRMATESQVDISHSHPFWAYPFCDVTVVHNGQLTNYHKLKRRYEDRGYRFQTHNDSELIAVYMADKLAHGATLKEALQDSLRDLDGTFTFLVSTEDSIGYAKDQWSAKPLVIMETNDVVAIASEEVALRSVFAQEIDRIEPQENEVMTWSS